MPVLPPPCGRPWVPGMELQGPDFADSRDPIFSDFRDPMIIFADSRNPIFNSKDPNRVPKTP